MILQKPDETPIRTVIISYWQSPYDSGERCVRMSEEIAEELTRQFQAQGLIVEWKEECHKGTFEHRERMEIALKAMHELTGIPYDPDCDVLQALEAAVSMLRDARGDSCPSF